MPTGLRAQLAAPPQHPWLVTPLESNAYFSNLQSGDKVQSPFVARFGLSSPWGLAPAGHEIPKTGHHYLLIDRPLPVPAVPAPVDRHHVDFGKGQMEAVLNLEPGVHTLRLLLVDHQRIPRFVYSKELTIEVLPGTSALSDSHGRVPRVELLNLRNGQVLKPPFRLNFHASALNIAHQASAVPNTGYFRVRLKPLTGRSTQEVIISFPNGATEALFNPPEGSYEVQLFYVQNPGNVLTSVVSETYRVVVRK